MLNFDEWLLEKLNLRQLISKWKGGREDANPEFSGFDSKSKILKFKCGEHEQEVSMIGYKSSELSKEKAMRFLKEKDVKVHCTCKSFLYSGAKYNNWKEGSGTRKEDRVPAKSDPKGENFLCKHLYAVLSNIETLIR